METTIIQNLWTRSKLLIKVMVIGLLILLLQLPVYYVKDLIAEREQRQKEAITEVSGKWAGAQNITGPMIGLPYWQNDNNNIKTKHTAWLLPDVLIANANITPQERHRGIYKVILYTAGINISGSFDSISLQKMNIVPEDIIWSEAFIKIAISDTKGLNDELKLKWNGRELNLTPESFEGKSASEDLTAPLGIHSPEELQHITFGTQFYISGSGQLLLTPVGKVTTATITSVWPHPSFTGNTLPTDSNIKGAGFKATWKSLSHKRTFPQQWKDEAFYIGAATDMSSHNISAAAFGTELFVPVNGYQKTMRSIKYSILCILLTFAAFFIIETRAKKAVHPFQYGLIGLALVLFYTLLLSFSEYTGFNAAYIIAALATIGLITPFVKSLLSSMRLSVILSVVLVLVYSYVFTILQMQDYSLLFGSVGLFITLGIIMYFSRKLQW